MTDDRGKTYTVDPEAEMAALRTENERLRGALEAIAEPGPSYLTDTGVASHRADIARAALAKTEGHPR